MDADWAGGWTDRSSNDPITAYSRTGYVIRYAGCPIVWASKLQTLIALSTTEAEYIALSTALREVIAIIHLLEELKLRGFPIHPGTPRVTCRTFEDNRSCIEIATKHKTRARTKHLSVKLHHFRDHVVKKIITIVHVGTKDQIADIFTKALPLTQFQILSRRLMNWPDPKPRGSEGILVPDISKSRTDVVQSPGQTALEKGGSRKNATHGRVKVLQVVNREHVSANTLQAGRAPLQLSNTASPATVRAKETYPPMKDPTVSQHRHLPARSFEFKTS